MPHLPRWIRPHRWVAGALLALSAFVLAPEPVSAAEPQVYSVIEGTETSTGNVAVVVLGKRVSKFKVFEIADADGNSLGAVTQSYKSKSIIVLSLPATIVPGEYELRLATGKTRSPVQSHQVFISGGGVLPGTVLDTALDDALRSDLDDAATLAGKLPAFYRNATNVDAGTLDTARFSALSDLVDELAIGLNAGQLSPGNHAHDDRYRTRGELADPGTLNAGTNPVDWSKLKNVPTRLATGGDETVYTAGSGLSLTGFEFSVSDVPFSALTGVPTDLSDGDDDTTYSAGSGLTLTGTTFSVDAIDFGDLTGTPSGLADGDDDTTYSAGSGLTLTGTTFSVDAVDFGDLTGTPSGLADGDDDTTYSAGSGLTLTGTTFSVDAIDFGDLTGTPSGLDDGDDDTTYSAGSGLTLTGTTFSVDAIDFGDLTGTPSGLADGDDDTTYTAGSGLTLTGTTFSVDAIDFGDLIGTPSGLADGDDDTTYSAGSGLTLTGTTFSVDAIDFGDLTGTPSGLADGDDDTTYSAGSGLTLTGTTFSVDAIDFGDLTGTPSGLADGDDDTTYLAGSGLTLTGTTFSVDAIDFGDLTGTPSGLADGDDDTTYTAGTGLSLSAGAFAVDFAGTGTASTASHSDHDHDTDYVELAGDTMSGGLAVSTTDSTAVAGTATATTGSTYGVVGLSKSSSGVGVHGRADATSTGSSAIGVLAESNVGSGNALVVRHYQKTTTQSTTSNNLAIFQSHRYIVDADIPWGTAPVNRARIDINGKGYFNGGTATAGADFAESVDVEGDAASYEPGDVMVVSLEGDRRFARSADPESTLVAGVYSTKPAVLGSAHPDVAGTDNYTEGEIPLGVVGIVPTKVCDENGPIRRGDLLVTSSRPGHAMRAPEHPRAGTIVGKALGTLESGNGVIEILLSLQ